MESFSALMSKYVVSILIHSPYTINDISILHIMFMDDLIVFSKCTSITAANLRAFFYHFANFSTLEVNWAKCFVFSLTVHKMTKRLLLSCLV